MLWAKSNKAALKSGAYFATRKNTIELPHDALAHSYNAFDMCDNLTMLAPDIVAAILDDALPNHITLFDLAVDPPALWGEQRERVGMPS